MGVWRFCSTFRAFCPRAERPPNNLFTSAKISPHLAFRGGLCDCRPVKSLEPPDTFHLSAAMGWLGLGNWQEALEELEKITPALRSHPEVLLARFWFWATPSSGSRWLCATRTRNRFGR